MKISKIALAVAALAAGTAATAAPNGNEIAISAGASATRANLITVLRNLCEANPAPRVFTSLGSGNFRSFVCADTAVTEGASGTYLSKAPANFKKFVGTNFVEVRLNTEGSFSAIELLNGVAKVVRDPATASNSSTYPSGSVIVGGLLDLEPQAFPSDVTGSFVIPSATPVGIGQTFGVAASGALYTLMFNAQQAAGKIPAAPTCLVTTTANPACVPSVTRMQMRLILNDNSFNAAYSNGVGFLTGNAADNGKVLRYVRRVNESGTQAAANNEFLGLGCSKTGLALVAQPTGDEEAGGLKDILIGAINVLAAPGTGDVLTELNRTTQPNFGGSGTTDNWSIGVVSGENVPTTATTWRWLRLDDVAIGENAKPDTVGLTNITTHATGAYTFYYESVYAGGGAAGDAFWSTISTSLSALTGPGLIPAATLSSTFTKAGNSCQPSVQQF